MSDKIGIHFGALAPTLEQQLEEQGLAMSEGDIEMLQKDIDGVVRLRLRGILTDGEANKAHRRIMKQISSRARSTDATKEEGKK